MANRHEGDPSSEIVDLQTFTEWVRTWRRRMITDQTVKHDLLPVPPGLGGGTSVDIFGFPWSEVPLTIKEILAISYQAALETTPDQSVDILTERGQLRFTLNSQYVVNDIDTIGESDIRHGVTLHFGERGYESVHNGLWDLSTATISSRSIAREIFGKEDRTTEDLDRLYSTFRVRDTSVTLPQMHDVARLLEKSKPYAVVLRQVPQASRRR